MNPHKIAIYTALLCIPTTGCKDKSDDASSETTLTTITATEGTSDGSGTTAGDTTGVDTTGVDTGDEGPDCMPGTLACECDAGCCDSGLSCHPNDVCIEEACPPGELGCPCPDGTCGGGTSCNDPLSCVDGFCLDLSEPSCLDPYETCWDNAGGSQGDCCPGSSCVGYESTNEWGCALPCLNHSECVTDCCVNIDFGGGETQTMCSPTVQRCIDVGKCIDTCPWANDGACDDGGPGSEYSLCELGTDCADCGTRLP